MIITLCGSMKFEKEIMEEARGLTLNGILVFTPIFAHGETTSKEKEIRRQVHFNKIRMSDEVRIVNPGGYIGHDTQLEIDFTEGIKKPISYTYSATNVSV